jgi:hypothetical protein
MTSVPDDSKKIVKDAETIKREMQEVAKIRYDHHQQKRLRKLQVINSFAEQ